MGCLFCGSDGPYEKEEHIIPAGLGNKEFILKGEVCDKCNNYFGSSFENSVLSHTIFAFWKVLQKIPNRNNKNPVADFHIKLGQSGYFPNPEGLFDKHTQAKFYVDKDGTSRLEVENYESVVTKKEDGKDRFTINLVFTPEIVSLIGRFLGKIALEWMCIKTPDIARSNEFDTLRNYVRYGISSTKDNLWPVFLFNVQPHRAWLKTESGILVNREIFVIDSQIIKFNQFTVSFFQFGQQIWSIVMSDYRPEMKQLIMKTLGSNKPIMIWYDIKKMKKRPTI